MAPFKVIIVGGSVTGLTLANILERYNIDYVLLEKGPVIAPQLGAGFAILPNGARILDQLGCYEMLSRNNEPVNSIESFDQYGTLRERQPEIGRWMQEWYVVLSKRHSMSVSLSLDQLRVQDAFYGSTASRAGNFRQLAGQIQGPHQL